MRVDSLGVKATLRKGRLAAESRMDVMRFSLVIAKIWEIDSLLFQRSKLPSFVARDPDVRAAALMGDTTFKKFGTCQLARGKIPPVNRPRKRRPRLNSAIIGLNSFVTRDIKGRVALIGAISRDRGGQRHSLPKRNISQRENAQYFVNSHKFTRKL